MALLIFYFTEHVLEYLQRRLLREVTEIDVSDSGIEAWHGMLGIIRYGIDEVLRRITQTGAPRHIFAIAFEGFIGQITFRVFVHAVIKTTAANAEILKSYQFIPSVKGGQEALVNVSRDLKTIGMLQESTDPDELATRSFKTFEGVPDSYKTEDGKLVAVE